MIATRIPRLALACLAIAGLLAGCADGGEQSAPAAPAPAGTVDEVRLQRFFVLMDENGDGAISRPEFQSGKGSVFMAMDADGSMALTPNETRLKPEAFDLLAGGDGMIDGEEFIASELAQFDRIDTDRDYQLSYEELRDYLAKYE
ncbi:MAG: hypothetical protein JNN33_12900 [Rhodospirillaceae bacterium]|jgi:Ca2+-binding EF-hand superfamily protein|nr:hypothetical protein [Rhodospirillaceae bacterium]